MTEHPHQLRTVMIGDEPAAWVAAGFTVVDDHFRIANTVVLLTGTSDGRGIRAVTVDGIRRPIDEMPFGHAATRDAVHVGHQNRVVDFDHLVAMSPDMDRTTAALEAAGLEHRRTRTFDAGERVMRQAFYWLGDVILELAGDDTNHDEGPATLWGLALTCDDLHGATAHLGDALGPVKPAVQRGREIATVRTRELDISVPIALMSPHPAADA